MPVYYPMGNALVTEDELREKEALGKIAEFESAGTGKRNGAAVEFSTGRMTRDNQLESFTGGQGDLVPFKEVGIGKPLALEIRQIYTGKYPKTGWFDDDSDLLVTSAMKSIATFNAAPRAINFLTKKVKPKRNLSSTSATQDGTPLIHYTPALTEYNTVLTIELGFDDFDSDIFKVLGNAFQGAAGVPIFASASQYLIAASMVTNIAEDLGSALFDKKPVFEATVPIEFFRPGSNRAGPGFRLITDDDLDRFVLEGFSVNATGELVDDGGKKYDGKTPYVVISLDGHKNDSYKDFAPTAASAALLEKFYKIGSQKSGELGTLMDALKLYNDWKFRLKADDLKDDLAKLAPGTDEHDRKKVEYDASIENILNDLLKPAS